MSKLLKFGAGILLIFLLLLCAMGVADGYFLDGMQGHYLAWRAEAGGYEKTVYSNGYSDSGFREVKEGMTAAHVEALLGKPLCRQLICQNQEAPAGLLIVTEGRAYFPETSSCNAEVDVKTLPIESALASCIPTPSETWVYSDSYRPKHVLDRGVGHHRSRVIGFKLGKVNFKSAGYTFSESPLMTLLGVLLHPTEIVPKPAPKPPIAPPPFANDIHYPYSTSNCAEYDFADPHLQNGVTTELDVLHLFDGSPYLRLTFPEPRAKTMAGLQFQFDRLSFYEICKPIKQPAAYQNLRVRTVWVYLFFRDGVLAHYSINDNRTIIDPPQNIQGPLTANYLYPDPASADPSERVPNLRADVRAYCQARSAEFRKESFCH